MTGAAMIEDIGIFLGVAIMAGLNTAGLVLLLRFWAGKLTSIIRICLGTIAGPSIIIGILLVASSESADVEPADIVSILAVLALLSIIIGLPVSLLATRKLDRMLDVALVPDIAIFE